MLTMQIIGGEIMSVIKVQKIPTIICERKTKPVGKYFHLPNIARHRISTDEHGVEQYAFYVKNYRLADAVSRPGEIGHG